MPRWTMESTTTRLRSRRSGDASSRALLYVLVLVLVSVAAIAFALQVTPEQSVSILGQSVSVGATAPSLSLSGPGELVLFGQSLPTRVEFVGPVRPRLVLTDITINEQVEACSLRARGSKTAEVGAGARPRVPTVLRVADRIRRPRRRAAARRDRRLARLRVEEDRGHHPRRDAVRRGPQHRGDHGHGRHRTGRVARGSAA